MSNLFGNYIVVFSHEAAHFVMLTVNSHLCNLVGKKMQSDIESTVGCQVLEHCIHLK